MSAPDDKDLHINPHPDVSGMSDGSFLVQRLLASEIGKGPDWNHTLFTECEYCHRKIKVILRAPLNAPKFIQDEACRVAILQHLRTGHKAKPKNSKQDTTKINLMKYLPEIFLAVCEKYEITPTQFVLTVNIAEQTVSLFEQNKFVKKFPCSTSRFGIGQTEGSNHTPLGLHRIAEKIGAGAPAGAVFKSRQIIGHTSQPEFADAKITTRILWLEGLEPGFNRGGNVDSHARYIYIHGTGDQTTIGRPASCGCIHLADADLIPLFDKLPSGTLVWIER
jgi:hypothetical protein